MFRLVCTLPIFGRFRFLAGMWRSQPHCNDAVCTCLPPDHAKTHALSPAPAIRVGLRRRGAQYTRCFCRACTEAGKCVVPSLGCSARCSLTWYIACLHMFSHSLEIEESPGLLVKSVLHPLYIWLFFCIAVTADESDNSRLAQHHIHPSEGVDIKMLKSCSSFYLVMSYDT